MRAVWWRRNRWALLALPLVVALAAFAGSYRIGVFWDPYELTDPVDGKAGEPLVFTDTIPDPTGDLEVAVTLTAGPSTVTDHYDDADGKMQYFPRHEGTRIWVTELTYDVEPGTFVEACDVVVVDQEGRRSLYGGANLDILGAPSVCAPPLVATDEGTTLPRPDSYTLPVYVRLADGAEPTQLYVYWKTPRFARIVLDPQGGER